MNRFIARIIASLLVPCLLTDCALIFAFHTHHSLACVKEANFSEQALAPVPATISSLTHASKELAAAEADVARQSGEIPPEASTGKSDGVPEGSEADLTYIEAVLTAFKDALAKDLLRRGQAQTFAEAVPDRAARLDALSYVFTKVRDENPSDFWMQPTLLLDDQQAILLFKDGPNGIRYGSKPVAYRFSLAEPPPEGTGQELRDRLHWKRGLYLHQFHDIERVYLAMRAIGHAPILNTGQFEHNILGSESIFNHPAFESDRGRLPPEALSAFYRGIARRWEGHKKLNELQQYATVQSRHHKILRTDEAALILEHAESSILDFEEALRDMESSRALMQGQAEPPILRKNIDFDEELEALRNMLQIAQGIAAFSRGEIPDQESELLDVLKLGFVESPRNTEMADPREANPLVLAGGHDGRGGVIRLHLPPPDVLEAARLSGNTRFLGFALENAIKGAAGVSRPDQPVDFSVIVDEAATTFSIADDGPGIAEENIWKISDSDYTTKTGETGHAVTRRVILEQHGGYVEIDSLTKEDAANPEKIAARRSKGKRTTVGTTITMIWPKTPSGTPMPETDRLDPSLRLVPAAAREAMKAQTAVRAAVEALRADAPLYPLPPVVLASIKTFIARCEAVTNRFLHCSQEISRTDKAQLLKNFLADWPQEMAALRSLIQTLTDEPSIRELSFHFQKEGRYEENVDFLSERLRPIVERFPGLSPRTPLKPAQLDDLSRSLLDVFQRFHLAASESHDVVEMRARIERLRQALQAQNDFESTKARERMELLNDIERETAALIKDYPNNRSDPRIAGDNWIEEYDEKRQNDWYRDIAARRGALDEREIAARSALAHWLKGLLDRPESLTTRHILEKPIDRQGVLFESLFRIAEPVTALDESMALFHDLASLASGRRSVFSGLESFGSLYTRLLRGRTTSMLDIRMGPIASSEEQALVDGFEQMTDTQLEDIFRDMKLPTGPNEENVLALSLYQFLRNDYWLVHTPRELEQIILSIQANLALDLLTEKERNELSERLNVLLRKRAYLRALFRRWTDGQVYKPSNLPVAPAKDLRFFKLRDEFISLIRKIGPNPPGLTPRQQQYLAALLDPALKNIQQIVDAFHVSRDTIFDRLDSIHIYLREVLALLDPKTEFERWAVEELPIKVLEVLEKLHRGGQNFWRLSKIEHEVEAIISPQETPYFLLYYVRAALAFLAMHDDRVEIRPGSPVKYRLNLPIWAPTWEERTAAALLKLSRRLQERFPETFGDPGTSQAWMSEFYKEILEKDQTWHRRENLSKSRQEVWELLVSGFSQTETAEKLGLSALAVRAREKDILSELELRARWFKAGMKAA